MATPRSNIELANNRFVKAVEWNGEMRIDIREYDDKVQGKIPTKKGISLPLHRWKLLVDSFEFLDQALSEQRDYSTHIGGNVYFTLNVTNPFATVIHIRQYFLPPNQTEVIPTKKGICLRLAEYEKLKDTASVIGDFVPELTSIVPCPYSSDHLNQLGFLRCSECNPDHCTEF